MSSSLHNVTRLPDKLLAQNLDRRGEFVISFSVMEGTRWNKWESEICHRVQGFAAYKEGLKDNVEGFRTWRLMKKGEQKFRKLTYFKILMCTFILIQRAVL